MNSPRSIQNPSRREFLRTGTAAVAGSAVVWGLPAMLRGAPDDRELTLGLVGCGGRGTGAALQALALAADANTTITAVGDGQWFRVEITTGSGQQGQCFDVTVATPDAAEQRFNDLPLASRRFADEGCNHIVIYGLGQQAGSFHVDNVRFRALVSEDAGKQ